METKRYVIISLFCPSHIVEVQGMDDLMIALTALRGIYPYNPFVAVDERGTILEA